MHVYDESNLESTESVHPTKFKVCGFYFTDFKFTIGHGHFYRLHGLLPDTTHPFLTTVITSFSFLDTGGLGVLPLVSFNGIGLVTCSPDD